MEIIDPFEQDAEQTPQQDWGNEPMQMQQEDIKDPFAEDTNATILEEVKDPFEGLSPDHGIDLTGGSPGAQLVEGTRMAFANYGKLGRLGRTSNLIDAVDLVVGIVPSAIGIFTNHGSRILGMAGVASNGATREERERIGAEAQQAVAASVALRPSLALLGYTDDHPSELAQAMELINPSDETLKKIEKKTGGRITAADARLIVDELMGLPMLKAAHGSLMGSAKMDAGIARYNTVEKITDALAEGGTPKEIAMRILEKATKDGMPGAKDVSATDLAKDVMDVAEISREAKLRARQIPEADAKAMKEDAAAWRKQRRERMRENITQTQFVQAYNQAVKEAGIKGSYDQLSAKRKASIHKEWIAQEARQQLELAGIPAEQAFGYKRAQLGAVDKQLVASISATLGGAALGVYAADDKVAGGLLGAATGLGVTMAAIYGPKAKVERRNADWTAEKRAKYMAAATVLQAANDMLKASDPNTVTHEARVAGSVARLSKALGLSTEQQVRANLAALGHDLGKTGMKDILEKQAALTKDDMTLLRTHPEGTVKIMQALGIPENIIKTAGEHHQTAKPGVGYPRHGGSPDFSSLVVETADIGDSLIGGKNSGHDYPLKTIKDGKQIELPRTAHNVIQVMDDMAARGQLQPEVYKAYRDMFVRGEIPAAHKAQLESVGEVPWNRPTPMDTQTTVTGVHYSQEPHAELKGKMYGTGIRGQEAARLSEPGVDPRIKSRISFYIDEGQGIFPEGGVGSAKHVVKLENLYDAAKNPLQLPKEPNAFESAVIDAGYPGYYVKGAFDKQGAAVLLGDAAKSVKVEGKTPSITQQAFSPKNITDVLQKEDWAIITAENPKANALSSAENAVLMQELKATLDAKGLTYVEAKGKYAGNKENSLVVLGVSKAVAQDLGRLFEQESVLTKDGLLYSDGRVAPATGVTKHKQIPEDNYTHIPATGATFSIDLDFSLPKQVEPKPLGDIFNKQAGAFRMFAVGNGPVLKQMKVNGLEGAEYRAAEAHFKSDGVAAVIPEGDGVWRAVSNTGKETVIRETATLNLHQTDYFKSQLGAADRALIIKSGLALGGAALGPFLVAEGREIQGLIAGAALGFGLASLPKAVRAIHNNWKLALKTGAIGSAYAAVGAVVDQDNPVEGILVGSAIFGLRFLPKAKNHPEDDLIHARNGNIAAEARLTEKIAQAMETAVPDKLAREQISVLAEDPKFMGRTPEERAVVTTWRAFTQGYYELAKDAGLAMGFIEAYISHIIERNGLPQTEVAKIMGELLRTTGGAPGGMAKFIKHREYKTFADVEKAIEGTSLTIKTKDIAEITRIYSRAMTKAIENKKLINNLKEATLGDVEGRNARLLTTTPDSGYIQLDAPQLRGLYVHPDIAPSLRFVFDAKTHGEGINALLALNRATKRMNVLGSFFHAKSLLEAYSLAGGNLVTAKGAIDGALKQFKEGGFGDELDKGLRAGLRVEIPVDASVEAFAQVGQLADIYASKMLGHKTELLGTAGKKIESIQQHTFDRFTWDYLHTGLKLATYLRLMEEYKLGKAGKGLTEDQYRAGVASHVNDTFGGLDWYRVVSEAKSEAGRKRAAAILKPSSRDLLGIAAFAPDWGVSTFRAVSKALPGGAKNPANAQLARKYVLRTAILYSTVMTGINYALSGHFPWDNKDPTRIEFADGTSMQAVKHSMEFAEWVRDPVKTFSNKMGFFPKNIVALTSDKQYPHGPDIENKASFVAGQVLPFTARSFQSDVSAETSAKRALLGMFGVSIYGMSEEDRQLAREARARRKEEQASDEEE